MAKSKSDLPALSETVCQMPLILALQSHLLTGKAMVVAYSRPIAMEIYKHILKLRPTWTEKVGVVMTSDNKDPEEWRDVIGNKKYEKNCL